MRCYTKNTVYTNIQKNIVVPGCIDIYVENWTDQYGVYNDDGTLKIAAMIFWLPIQGYIWHYVTDVALLDYPYYKEILNNEYSQG